jgi:hypothetical protein
MKELYESTKSAEGFVTKAYENDQSNKQMLIRLWERNAAFANGNQAIIPQASSTMQFSGTNLYASDNQSLRSKAYITNEIEPIVRTLVSYATKAKPAVDVYAPEKNQQGDARAAIANRILDAKYSLDNEVMMSKMAAQYGFVYGSVFRKDYWDSSAGSKFQIPVYDELGNEVIDPATGDVQTREMNSGDSKVAILTPFSMTFDWSYTDFDCLPWIMESYLMPTEWGTEMFNKDEPGYTGAGAKITNGDAVGYSLQTLERLKYATPFNYGASVNTRLEGKALFQEMYVQPSQDLPKGRLLILANGIAVYDSFNNGEDLGSPYYMPYEKAMWHPYSMFINDLYVGRLLGKSLVESILPIQIRLNELNGAILQNANTLAKVDVLTPENCLKRGVLNGQGAQIYTYKPHPSGLKPEKWQGVPLPAQFFNEREMLIETMVRIAGTNMVMQGQPPKGVTAAAAIEQLLDNASSQRSDFMISWEKFHEQGFTKKLRIVRNFNKVPNKDIIDYLRMVSKDSLDMDLESFVGEDIGDGLSVKIEPGSMIPRSEKATRELFKEFAAQGLLGPVGEDSPRGAKLRKELLSKFGEKGFEVDQAADVDKAYWENDRMIRMMPVEVWEEDDHQIHLSCHISKAKEPKFLERASDEIKSAFMDHIAIHKQFLQQQQMQQQMAAMQAQMGGMPPQGMLPPGAPPPSDEGMPAPDGGMEAPGGMPEAPMMQ